MNNGEWSLIGGGLTNNSDESHLYETCELQTAVQRAGSTETKGNPPQLRTVLAAHVLLLDTLRRPSSEEPEFRFLPLSPGGCWLAAGQRDDCEAQDAELYRGTTRGRE